MGSRDPGLIRLVTRGSALTLPRPAIYAIKKPTGLGGEYQFAGADADCVFGSAFAVDSYGGAAQLLSLGDSTLYGLATDFRTLSVRASAFAC